MRKSLLMGLSGDKKRKSVTDGSIMDESDFPYDFLSFSEMRNVIDLLSLYIQVNEKVIE